ncbi:MAG: helix-turn-helix domain-containing protein [Eubacteriales bacterium]
MLSEKLKVLREQHHLTQMQIANILGISRVAYTKYESGQNTPTLDKLKKIADLFVVSVDYLLERTEIPTPYPVEEDSVEYIVMEMLSNSDIYDAFRDFQDWSDEEKRSLINIIKGQNLLREKK